MFFLVFFPCSFLSASFFRLCFCSFFSSSLFSFSFSFSFYFLFFFFLFFSGVQNLIFFGWLIFVPVAHKILHNKNQCLEPSRGVLGPPSPPGPPKISPFSPLPPLFSFMRLQACATNGVATCEMRCPEGWEAPLRAEARWSHHPKASCFDADNHLAASLDQHARSRWLHSDTQGRLM